VKSLADQAKRLDHQAKLKKAQTETKEQKVKATTDKAVKSISAKDAAKMTMEA
jgi:hypothetical protein